MAEFPDAHYLVLSSRLIPGLDGGYTVATLARARQFAAAGARPPLLLTVDPGAMSDHAAQRATFVARGDAASADLFRNLFDDVVADAAWLRAAARPGERDDVLEYRAVTAPDGAVVAELPVVHDPDWHLSTAPIVVPGAGIVDGFGALYAAWIAHVVAGVRAADGLPVVLVCESRQLGELLVDRLPAGVALVHTVHTAHLEPPYDADAPVNALWRRWLAVAPRFAAVVWPTARQLADVTARFGSRPGDAVVPNAVPVADASAADRASDHVVVLGRLAPGKRVADILRAWMIVRETVPGAVLDVVGDGPLRAELEALAHELGHGASVVFHGATTEPGAVLERAALLVQATAFEGQGLAALEALGHGCPVVSYDVRYGPRELLGTGAGVLVDDADAAALGEAVASLLRDPARRAALAARGREVAADYTPEAVMPRWADVVRHALERAAG